MCVITIAREVDREEMMEMHWTMANQRHHSASNTAGDAVGLYLRFGPLLRKVSHDKSKRLV